MYRPTSPRAKRIQEEILCYMAQRMQQGVETDDLYKEIEESWGYPRNTAQNIAPLKAAQALIDKEHAATKETAA